MYLAFCKYGRVNQGRFIDDHTVNCLNKSGETSILDEMEKNNMVKLI